MPSMKLTVQLSCVILLAAISPAKKELIDSLLTLTHASDHTPHVVEVYDRSMTTDQLRAAIAFFNSEPGKHYLATQSELTNPAAPAISISELDEQSLRRTRADLRALGTAVEAYATDENHFPAATEIETLARRLEPTYIKHAPRVDGWGMPFLYRVSSDGKSYRFVSAGPDRTFRTNDDVVFTDGEFK